LRSRKKIKKKRWLFFHDPHLVPPEHQPHGSVVPDRVELVRVDLIVGDPVITQHLVQAGRFRHPLLTIGEPAEFPVQCMNNLNKKTFLSILNKKVSQTQICSNDYFQVAQTLNPPNFLYNAWMILTNTFFP